MGFCLRFQRVMCCRWEIILKKYGNNHNKLNVYSSDFTKYLGFAKSNIFRAKPTGYPSRGVFRLPLPKLKTQTLPKRTLSKEGGLDEAKMQFTKGGQTKPFTKRLCSVFSKGEFEGRFEAN